MYLLIRILFLTSLTLLIGNQAQSTTVSVYTENGYDESVNQLRVNVFADIGDDQNGGSVVSAGFKLTYGGGLTNPVPDKNVIDWYFGATPLTVPYIDPDTSSPGEIYFLLGILDENLPLEGVTGNRILLGSIVFNYSGGIPTSSNLSIEDGHKGAFIDFSTTEGIALDDLVFYSIGNVVPYENLLLKGVVRTLQTVSGTMSAEPARVANDDATDDGRIGLDDALHLLEQISR